MKKATNIVSVFMFLQLALSFAVSLTPFPSYLFPLTFLLPVPLIFVSGLRFQAREEINFSLSPILSFLPLFPAFLCAVALTSTFTAIVSSAVGYTPSPVIPTGNIAQIIFTHILFPAISEELFCRFLCLSILSPYGKKGAVIVSAILFAIMHGNFYQMPYAFIAGIFLGAITLASGSILPAIVFHILNNAFSVIVYYAGVPLTLALYGAAFVLFPIGVAICAKTGAYGKLRNIAVDASAREGLFSLLSPLCILYVLFMLALSV